MKNPQNPYDSYIIEASAGAGKTYQLTRRFLNLVSAGSHASKILTITFTVKAAQEMKERILHEASELLYNQEKQNKFDKDMQAFYKDFARKHPFSIPPPRKAYETAEEILSCTQLLRITTIDALFYDWFSSFPWEANPFPQFMNTRSLPYEMIEDRQREELNQKAWEDVLVKASKESLPHCLALLDLDSGQGILGIEQRIFELFRNYTYLWQSEQEQGSCSFFYDLGNPYSESDFFKNVGEELSIVISQLKNKEIFFEAFYKASIQTLIESRLFNQEGELSGLYLRGKTREKFSREIAKIDEAMQQYLRVDKLSKLNKMSEAYFQLYRLWILEREKLKQSQGLVEFHDLAIGNYRLFHDPSSMGACWFLQKSFQHLMIDECQDTSFLQFSVFRKLIEETLASMQENLPHTVFLVGDKKQSIYGFREAEPEVLAHMTDLFHSFEKTCIPLHKSYRSAPSLLNFVNLVFSKHIDPNFPLHETAKDEAGNYVIPDCSRIVVQTLSPLQQEKEDSLREEAEYLARYIKEALAKEDSHPVYDKKTQSFRPLQASDCVILYRTSTNLEIFEEILSEYSIPYIKEEKRGLFSCLDVQETLSLFRFLCDETDTISLLSFLKSPWGGLSDPEILDILHKTQKEERRNLAILDVLKGREIEKSLRLWKKVLDDYAPSQLFYSIFLKEGEASKNLYKLYEIFLVLEARYPTLQALLKELELRALSDKDAAESSEAEAIRLMTIHKSKGLEFPFVALIKSSELWYRVDRYWTKVQTGTERSLAYVGTQAQRPKEDRQITSLLSSTERNLQEEAERLLYVALTRASQYLLITAHQNKAVGDSFYPLLQESANSFPMN